MLEQYTIPNFLCYWLMSVHRLKWRLWCPASGMSSHPLLGLCPLVRYPLGNCVPRPRLHPLFGKFLDSPLKTVAQTMCHTSRLTTPGNFTMQLRVLVAYTVYTVLPAALWVDRSDAGIMRRMHILMYCISSHAWLVLRRFYCSIDGFILCT